MKKITYDVYEVVHGGISHEKSVVMVESGFASKKDLQIRFGQSAKIKMLAESCAGACFYTSNMMVGFHEPIKVAS